jgi:hypothetical protein
MVAAVTGLFCAVVNHTFSIFLVHKGRPERGVVEPSVYWVPQDSFSGPVDEQEPYRFWVGFPNDRIKPIDEAAKPA